MCAPHHCASSLQRVKWKSEPTYALRARASHFPDQALVFSTRSVDSVSSTRPGCGAGVRGGRGEEEATSQARCIADLPQGARIPGRLAPTPAMTAPRPHRPAKLPARPKFSGVFRCVEDAFENKTLPLDPHQSSRAQDPHRETRGHSERPGEPDVEDPAAAASHRGQPVVAPAGSPSQVEAAGPRSQAEGSVRVGCGPRLRETPHSHTDSVGLELIFPLPLGAWTSSCDPPPPGLASWSPVLLGLSVPHSLSVRVSPDPLRAAARGTARGWRLHSLVLRSGHCLVLVLQPRSSQRRLALVRDLFQDSGIPRGDLV